MSVAFRHLAPTLRHLSMSQEAPECPHDTDANADGDDGGAAGMAQLAAALLEATRLSRPELRDCIHTRVLLFYFCMSGIPGHKLMHVRVPRDTSSNMSGCPKCCFRGLRTRTPAAAVVSAYSSQTKARHRPK